MQISPIPELTDQYQYGTLPFSLLFQISALARNGVLHPCKVRSLLPKILEIFEGSDSGAKTALIAMRRFTVQVPSPGPGMEAISTQAMEDMLTKFAEDYERFHYDPEDPYQLAERYQHINLIHKIVVKPLEFS